jgi:hypothetical protein
MTLAIDYRSPAELRPYDRNARTHSDAQVAQIAASIAEFGFTNPILAGSDGVIAADRLGMCARLVELDPRYADVIVQRWEAWSGRKAEVTRA